MPSHQRQARIAEAAPGALVSRPLPNAPVSPCQTPNGRPSAYTVSGPHVQAAGHIPGATQENLRPLLLSGNLFAWYPLNKSLCFIVLCNVSVVKKPLFPAFTKSRNSAPEAGERATWSSGNRRLSVFAPEYVVVKMKGCNTADRAVILLRLFY